MLGTRRDVVEDVRRHVVEDVCEHVEKLGDGSGDAFPEGGML